MEVIRVDTNQEYKHQKWNDIRPTITCASTSMAMGLLYSGWMPILQRLVTDVGKLPDHITTHIHTHPSVIKFWSTHTERWIRDAYKTYLEYSTGIRKESATSFGNEIHPVMEFAINSWLNQSEPIVKFYWNCSQKDIAFNLLTGGTVITSGLFPHARLGKIAHVVCLTGFETTQADIRSVETSTDINLTKIQSWWIDDPYGNYKVGYARAGGSSIESGDNIQMSTADFEKILHPENIKGAKRATLIRKYTGLDRATTPPGGFIIQ